MKNMDIEESYMTVNEFCERLQISTLTAYHMIKEEQIPAIKFGRRYKIPRSVFGNISVQYPYMRHSSASKGF